MVIKFKILINMEVNNLGKSKEIIKKIKESKIGEFEITIEEKKDVILEILKLSGILWDLQIITFEEFQKIVSVFVNFKK
jgi:hypothetical protein